MKSQELLNFSADVDFYSCEGIVEALMNHASRASWVGHLSRLLEYLSGVQVDDPVLETDSAPEGNNDSIIFWGVSGVAKDVEDRIIEGFGLDNTTNTLMSLYYEQYLHVQALISA